MLSPELCWDDARREGDLGRLQSPAGGWGYTISWGYTPYTLGIQEERVCGARGVNS